MPALARFGLFLLAFGLIADLLLHASGSDGYPAHAMRFRPLSFSWFTWRHS